MYVGRDMSELSMMSKNDWQDKELSYFHFALSQIAPYLNQEGTVILREINEEIEQRGGLVRNEATWTSGTHPTMD
ncbi:cytosolic protein [Thalassobacillus hwangdonensis]|uniref:Cytosolic protein n=1 Tax=Thalassobacillus hwangdonensis TaxID=546108 RepID=A0ABW3L5K6_9BACI